VLAFDFRGHGESTKIDPQIYWRFNPPARAFLPNRPMPNTVSYKDFEFQRDYRTYARFGNDITAAKIWLNVKNNQNECNASNCILIGADQGALLAYLWLWHEVKRSYQPLPLLIPAQGPIFLRAQCEDVSAIISLSMRPEVGYQAVPNLQQYLKVTLIGLRDYKVRSLVLYGEKDEPSRKFWYGFRGNDGALEWIRPTLDPQLRGQFVNTKSKGFKTELVGPLLLEKPGVLDTEEYIKEYLAKDIENKQWKSKKEDDTELMRAATTNGLFAIEQVLPR
jgi:hypothetical protein